MSKRLLLFLAALLTGPAIADEVAHAGDLEMRCMVVPTLELTAEAAKSFNVEREAGRGLLTVTLRKNGQAGKSEAGAAQVYAGAITQRNILYSIPIREVHQPDGVYYLGEFRVNAPDALRFLVNANVLGKPIKAEFFHIFNAR